MLEAREATLSYGGARYEVAAPGGCPPGVRGEVTGRWVTEELPPGAPIHGSVRLRIEVDAPGTALGCRAFLVALAPGADVTLGSAASADVLVDDPAVSGRHCRVTHVGAFVEIADLGARNGVRVGGVRVSRAALPVGACWEIGRSRVRILPARSASYQREEPLLEGLVGTSPPMRLLAGAVRRIASLRLPALLRGESGTGKDLVARALHDESLRAEHPFVVLNAAAITRELAESELFGHQRGAFTGAVRDRRGAFREAHGGTLFLDEIGAVPLEVQAKLLRVVEEGMVRPLGGEAAVPVDVRLVAATCEPLELLVAQRRFRADLYERLAVCVVQVPPLRDRLEDLPALVEHLLRASEMGGREPSRDALAALQAYRWPGNVRELRNVVVQAAVRASGGTIQAEHVSDVLAERTGRARRLAPGDAVRLFEEVGLNVSEAARRADLPRSTMRDLLRAAGVARWPRKGEAY